MTYVCARDDDDCSLADYYLYILQIPFLSFLIE